MNKLWAFLWLVVVLVLVLGVEVLWEWRHELGLLSQPEPEMEFVEGQFVEIGPEDSEELGLNWLPMPDPEGDVVIVIGSIWDDCLMRWSGPGWDVCLRPDGEVERNGDVMPDAAEFWQTLADAFPRWKAEVCGFKGTLGVQ